MATDPIIQPLVHRCVVQSGPCAGNKHEHTVTAENFLYGGCNVCNDVYASTEELVAHIYEQLTQGAQT